MTSSASSPVLPAARTDLAARRRLVLAGVAGAGLALGVAVAGLVLSGGVAPAPAATVVVALLVGWSFLGVGLFAWRRRPDNAVGRLLVAVCFAWFVAGLAGASDPALHTAGLAVAGVYYAVLVHLLLAFPHGRVRGRLERAALAVAYLAATVGQLLVLTVSDPPGPGNLLQVRRDAALGAVVTDAVALLGAAVTLLVAGVLVRRRRAATAGQRRALAPVLAAGAAVAVLLAANLVLGVLAPASPLVGEVALAAAVVLGAVPYAFLAGLARARFFTAAAVTDLLTRLADSSAGAGRGGVRAALAAALDDPQLSLAYWLPGPGEWVDAAGAPVQVPPPGRAATVVERDGQPVAALVHDPAGDADPDLVRAAGAAAALGLDNERLHAELRARVTEVEGSRRRVVEAAETERRRLERDLHDGAQQRLVALRVTLALARAAAAQDPAAAGRLLEDAGSELDAALGELRDLARGLHPALLATRGLPAALAALAARAPVPVDLAVDLEDRPGRDPTGDAGNDADPDVGNDGGPDPDPDGGQVSCRGPASGAEDRLPPALESTVYFLVAEALTNLAKHADATRARVRVLRRGHRLHVEVGDDGAGGADPGGSGLRGLAARVTALDGVLSVDSPPGGGTVLRGQFPLAATPASQLDPSPLDPREAS